MIREGAPLATSAALDLSDPYNDQAWHRYSYARNNPATLTDPTGYWVPPAWLCGSIGSIGPAGFSFGS